MPTVHTHTQLCLQRQAALAEYEKRYPNYCRRCTGSGVLSSPGSREEPPSDDPMLVR
jgi:hypothetical protein